MRQTPRTIERTITAGLLAMLASACASHRAPPAAPPAPMSRSAACMPLPVRAANACVAAVAYLGRTVWPADLAIVYPHPYLAAGGHWTARFLVEAALAAEVDVTVLPGPSAVETALVVSGLGVGQYRFLGYLPRRAAELGAGSHAEVKDKLAFVHGLAQARGLDMDAVAFMGDDLADVAVTISAHASAEGKLFGSVSPRDIAEALRAAGQHVSKGEVILSEGPLRNIGEYDVPVSLHADVQTTVKVIIVSDK